MAAGVNRGTAVLLLQLRSGTDANLIRFPGERCLIQLPSGCHFIWFRQIIELPEGAREHRFIKALQQQQQQPASFLRLIKVCRNMSSCL